MIAYNVNRLIIKQLISFILITSIEFERYVSRYSLLLLNELPNYSKVIAALFNATNT